MQPWKYRDQMGYLAAGQHDEVAAGVFQARKRVDGGLIDGAMRGDRAVVIGAQREVSHTAVSTFRVASRGNAGLELQVPVVRVEQIRTRRRYFFAYAFACRPTISMRF